MSEYQYYEFRVVEHPLDQDEMSQLRALSTRAVITPTSFTNTYHWGDFRGNPRKLMEGYFDAHVYVSNWGTVIFMLRLPRGVLSNDTLASYSTKATDDGLDAWATDQHTLLEWRRDDDSDDEWLEGEGWLAQLLPLRDELVRGDYRSLYIGWLSSFTGELQEREEWEENKRQSEKSRREPPVPPGLGTLTDAQVALVEFLSVNNDLIAAAAKSSSPVSAQDSLTMEVDGWVAQLPEQELRAVVARIINGEGMAIQTELQSRYYRTLRKSPQSSVGGGENRRTADALVAVATNTAQERNRLEMEAQERKRRAYLVDLGLRFPALWATASALAEEKKASSYDKAFAMLLDMRDAYALAGRRPDFDVEFARFQERHSQRAALMRRLKEI